ncbi:hypothetical protein K5D56_26210 [Pseudomonas cichorii]|nr:hypothetical protein [Pseudomonas cichorii]MBX8557013.1 hypothetical protein [Pseudomonas cichorii]MBX8592872.1 hypothetical protein [Pseudomonas cichorii]
MPTMKEIQMQKIHSIIESIKEASVRDATDNIEWHWARAHSYADCLQSCQLITPEEANKLQGLAFAARGD